MIRKRLLPRKSPGIADYLEKVVEDNNLVISYSLFWKELLRDQGYTIGRLDSRYEGIPTARQTARATDLIITRN